MSNTNDVDDNTHGDNAGDNSQGRRRCVKGPSNLLGGRTSPHALSLQPSDVWRRRGRWMRKGKMGRGQKESHCIDWSLDGTEALH